MNEHVVRFLRNSGNPSLADQYVAAWTAHSEAATRFCQRVQELVFAASMSDEDWARVDAARHAAHETLAQWARVSAEFDTWFQQRFHEEAARQEGVPRTLTPSVTHREDRVE
jgi:hypothetical protein